MKQVKQLAIVFVLLFTFTVCYKLLLPWLISRQKDTYENSSAFSTFLHAYMSGDHNVFSTSREHAAGLVENICHTFHVLRGTVLVCDAVQMVNCNDGVIHITDDTSNPTRITCNVANVNDWVVWNIHKEHKTYAAICSRAGCTNRVSYVRAGRERGSVTSTLTFVQNIRQNANSTSVSCSIKGMPSVTADCRINVLDTPTVQVDVGTTELFAGDTAALRCSTSRSPPSPLSYTYTWNINCDVYHSNYLCEFTVKSEHNGRQVSCTVTYTQLSYIAGKTASVTLNVIPTTTPSTNTSMTGSNSRCSLAIAPPVNVEEQVNPISAHRTPTAKERSLKMVFRTLDMEL